MTHPRATYRQALRVAFDAAPGLAGVKVMKAWAMPSDEADLPALAVLTPGERATASTGNQVNKAAEIVVVLKTTGGEDIEDVLDTYSEVIEAEAIAVFMGLTPQPPLFGYSAADMKIEGGSAKRVGTLEMRFEVVRFTAEGAAS